MAKKKVFHGTMAKTSGGLTKPDLVKNKKGKVVSKKAAAIGKSNFDNGRKASAFRAWNFAFVRARWVLGITGFCPCGGDSKRGKAFLATTRALLAPEVD